MAVLLVVRRQKVNMRCQKLNKVGARARGRFAGFGVAARTLTVPMSVQLCCWRRH